MDAETDASHPETMWTRGGPIESALTRREVEVLEGRSIASVGDSATVGLWAFGTGAWVTGLVEAGVFPVAAMTALVPLLLVNSGVVQFISGLLLYRRTNTFLASALCSFGSLNATRGLMLLFQTVGWLHAGGYAWRIQGCLAEAYAWFALCLTLAAVKMNRVVLGMTVCTCLGFLLSGLPYLADSVGQGAWGAAGHAGGWFLVVTGAFAYYGGMAMTTNIAWQRALLPLGGKA